MPFLRLADASASKTDRKGLPCPFSLHAFEIRKESSRSGNSSKGDSGDKHNEVRKH